MRIKFLISIALAALLNSAVFAQSECNGGDASCKSGSSRTDAVSVEKKKAVRPLDAPNKRADGKGSTGQYDPCYECKGGHVEDKQGYLQR